MDRFWKEQEKQKIRCIFCNHYVEPKVRDYENTKRKICPLCGGTIEITYKQKKLVKRDW